MAVLSVSCQAKDGDAELRLDDMTIGNGWRKEGLCLVESERKEKGERDREQNQDRASNEAMRVQLGS